MHWLLLASALAAAGEAPSHASHETTPSTEDAQKLEADIARELGATPQPTPTPTPTPTGAQPATGGNPLARLLLLPDISAIGRANLSYVAPVTGARSPRGAPFGEPGRVRAVFDELELGLQAVVDPYARADAFIAFGAEGVDVEEAYLTWLGLPHGLLARGGKLFAPFGRVNPQHPHTWEFADRPLALQRLLAGDESLGGAGVLASWLAPLPWFAELQLAYQGVAPVTGEGSRPAGFARAAQFFDLGADTTVGAGVSGGLVEEGGGGWRDLAGADLYVKHRPGATGAYLALQAEAVTRRLRGVPDVAGGREWGGYAQAVWRPGRRTGYGVRLERAPGLDAASELRASGLFLLDLSEFQRLRFQGSWDRLPGGASGFEGIVSVEFSIGAHGAHPF